MGKRRQECGREEICSLSDVRLPDTQTTDQPAAMNPARAVTIRTIAAAPMSPS
jgi:hypothetical protein